MTCINDAQPSISVVTPCYNAADTIEATILSVKNQQYANIQHIIVDGGSTDGTIDILRRHPHLTWISEPDGGQADALNKGFKMAEGEVIGWLNADDMYAPGAVPRVAELFTVNRDVAMIHGDMTFVDQAGNFIRQAHGREFEIPDAILSNPINQPAAFFRRAAFEQVGYLRNDLHYTMDCEYWLRVGLQLRTKYFPETWAFFRVMPGTKTASRPEMFWLEALAIYDEYFARPGLIGDIESVKKLAYGRKHWLAATALLRAGDLSEAREHLQLALCRYGLLSTDYRSAISGCRYIERYEYESPRNSDWIDSLLINLPPSVKKNWRLQRDMRSFFYATRADYWAYCGDYVAVRLDTLRALWYGTSYWLHNRGFLRQGLKAWIGAGPTQTIDRAYHQVMSLRMFSR